MFVPVGAMAMEPPREEGVRSRPIDEERGSRGRHVSKQDRRKKNLEVSMTHTERETQRERESSNKSMKWS